MLTDYSLRMPGTVYGGEHALENIPRLLSGVKKAAVFSDNGILGAGLLEEPLRLMREAGVETEIFADLPTEPSCDEAQLVADRFRESGAEYIVAVGGGSVMDIAKLASVLSTKEYTVRTLLERPGLAKKSVRTLMIPTTAGTGSEATMNAIVAVPEREVKLGIVSAEMLPDQVILDARMIARLPRGIAAATGVDALCHAIECFTSRKANPFSDSFALEALELILANLEKACDDPEALPEKGKMLLGSFYAGVAISASGTTAVHALSYPLGGKYHIAHGISNAILLLPVMRYNEPAIRDRLALAYDRCFGNRGAYGEDAEKSAALLRRMEEILRHLEIPADLSRWKVGREELDFLTEAGMQQQRLLVNNRRALSAEDARAIYEQVLA